MGTSVKKQGVLSDKYLVRLNDGAPELLSEAALMLLVVQALVELDMPDAANHVELHARVRRGGT
jgi:hypothetical protein